MREVAGEPEQLQLERENERVGGRPAGPGLELVEEIEETCQRPKRAVVRLLLGEEAQHRLGTDEADVQPVRLLPSGVVGAEQLHAGHRLQLPAALVEHQLDVAERLEPGAEARLGLAHALGDRADPPAIERVEVEHTVRLAEAERAQHHRLGLVGPAGHRAQV